MRYVGTGCRAEKRGWMDEHDLICFILILVLTNAPSEEADHLLMPAPGRRI